MQGCSRIDQKPVMAVCDPSGSISWRTGGRWDRQVIRSCHSRGDRWLRYLAAAGIPLGQGAGQITTPMRHQRASSLLQRQDWYLAGRIDDQIRYTAKAEQSEAMSARWFRVGVGVQVMLLAATIVAVPTLSLAVFIGLFATVSSATNALSRLGRHDTLRVTSMRRTSSNSCETPLRKPARNPSQRVSIRRNWRFPESMACGWRGGRPETGGK